MALGQAVLGDNRERPSSQQGSKAGLEVSDSLEIPGLRAHLHLCNRNTTRDRGLSPSGLSREAVRQRTSPTTTVPGSCGEMAWRTGNGTKSERPACSASQALIRVRPTLTARTMQVWLVGPFPICTNSSLQPEGEGRPVSGGSLLPGSCQIPLHSTVLPMVRIWGEGTRRFWAHSLSPPLLLPYTHEGPGYPPRGLWQACQ